MILVIVLVGGISGLVITAFAGRSVGAERRRAAGELVAALATARVDAMRTGRPVLVEARCRDDRLRLSIGEREMNWPARGLALADSFGRPLEPARVRFLPSGRCDAQAWVLLVRDAARADSAGRMARVEFDPVSGAASLRREGDPPRVGVVEEIIR
ncbi:MAG: hypothetical protein JNK58_08970 [Phycisphaerae bacterium]|nr:hypothetical protein [Phycisphaerae bacterium]